jgi:hypothetical protein
MCVYIPETGIKAPSAYIWGSGATNSIQRISSEMRLVRSEGHNGIF